VVLNWKQTDAGSDHYNMPWGRPENSAYTVANPPLASDYLLPWGGPDSQ